MIQFIVLFPYIFRFTSGAVDRFLSSSRSLILCSIVENLSNKAHEQGNKNCEDSRSGFISYFAINGATQCLLPNLRIGTSILTSKLNLCYIYNYCLINLEMSNHHMHKSQT